MEKCRICLQNRRTLRSIHDKSDGISFADMIISIANVKIRNDDGMPDKLCYGCRKKLVEAYDFKIYIERSADMALQETSNLKRINFSDVNDIKIKIEIDCKPVMPNTDIFPEKLFKDGSNFISYNNTVIKKIENVKKRKTLSVVDFLNSIKTESDLDCDYQDYDVAVDNYPSDSGSNYSYENKQFKQKKKKKSNKYECYTPSQKKWSKFPHFSPIKPKFFGDLRLVPTQPAIINRKPRQKTKKILPSSEQSICPYCGKLSKSMNKHILLHTAEKIYKCELCPKAYFTESSLNHHRKLHAQTKQFKCNQCIAAFNCKSTLNSHMLMHSNEKSFVCNICNKAFKRRAILNRHMMIHNFGNKPIQCELCPRTFITKYNLRHHMRVHTGERPFRCDICSQPYSYKHDFNRHCLKKHGVFLKRRSVRVMNEEVLQQERALMRDLALRAQGIIKGDESENPFDGPQAALAYEQAMKAIQDNKIPISF